jgi:hypothetical protein
VALWFLILLIRRFTQMDLNDSLRLNDRKFLYK